MRLNRLALLVTPLVWSAVSFAQSGETAAPPEAAPTETAPAATSAAGGSGYSCKMNNLTRTVQVSYDNAGAKVPCKVNYAKETEAPGATQVLFSAAAEEGYCEKKAEEFVEKMKSNGWTCSAN